MTTTQTHAALLSDAEIAQCINQSRTNLFDRAGTTSFRIARAIEQALLAKLQPAQEPAQAGELPPHVATASKGSVAFFVKWTEAGKPLRGEIHLYTEDQMRAALAARKPLTDERINMIADRAASKCRGYEAISIYVAREVERAHGINGLEVKHG